MAHLGLAQERMREWIPSKPDRRDARRHDGNRRRVVSQEDEYADYRAKINPADSLAGPANEQESRNFGSSLPPGVVMLRKTQCGLAFPHPLGPILPGLRPTRPSIRINPACDSASSAASSLASGELGRRRETAASGSSKSQATRLVDLPFAGRCGLRRVRDHGRAAKCESGARSYESTESRETPANCCRHAADCYGSSAAPTYQTVAASRCGTNGGRRSLRHYPESREKTGRGGCCDSQELRCCEFPAPGRCRHRWNVRRHDRELTSLQRRNGSRHDSTCRHLDWGRPATPHVREHRSEFCSQLPQRHFPRLGPPMPRDRHARHR